MAKYLILIYGILIYGPSPPRHSETPWREGLRQNRDGCGWADLVWCTG